MVRLRNIEEPFRRYRNDVYRLALSYTKSPQEAEDICQTVFLKLMEQEISPEKEKAWLMQVTVNQCKNLLRSGWWKKTAPLEDYQGTAPEQNRDVYQGVMALPPRYRVVIYLRYYEEYSTAEIGKLLGISQTAVTTRLSRGREMLKKTLREESI